MSNWKHTLVVKDLLSESDDLTVDQLRLVAENFKSRIIKFCDLIGSANSFQWHGIISELSEFICDPRPTVDHFNVILDQLYDVADDTRVWIG